jgi:ribosomal-protein-alanine N-acetyltransferase
MHRDPEIMKTLGGLRDDERTREYLRVNLEHWERYGFGLWRLRSIESGTIVGRSALRHIDVEGRQEIEIGYALLPAYWGRGLATEVSRAMVELAFSRLDLGELVALALPENLASRHVMEKSGGVYEREVLRNGHRHVLYRFRRGNAATRQARTTNA